MKYILSFILFLTCFTAKAESFDYEYEGQKLTYTIIDEEARTCKLQNGWQYNNKIFPGNNVSGSVVIPSEVKYLRHNFKVVEIPEYAFYGCRGITSVTIPNSIMSIGRYAFNGCSGLNSIKIPNSVTSIGSHAFSGCI